MGGEARKIVHVLGLTDQRSQIRSEFERFFSHNVYKNLIERYLAGHHLRTRELVLNGRNEQKVCIGCTEKGNVQSLKYHVELTIN